jgi:16S rRNA processing protein RimM
VEQPGSAAESAPPDLVELGAVRGAYGVKGWVRVALRGSDGSVLQNVPTWWLLDHRQARPIVPTAHRRHGAELVAKWPGCESKEQADALKGARLAVPRIAFPAVGDGEVYWADLLGCRVVNRAGDELGVVLGLRENAGGQWLEVGGEPHGNVRLIPLVAQYVEAVDPSAREVRVDWDRDW